MPEYRDIEEVEETVVVPESVRYEILRYGGKADYSIIKTSLTRNKVWDVVIPNAGSWAMAVKVCNLLNSEGSEAGQTAESAPNPSTTREA